MTYLLCLISIILYFNLNFVQANAVNRFRPCVIAAARTASSSRTSVDVNKWAIAAEEIKPAPRILSRLPSLPIVVVTSTLGSFLQTLAVMLPVGMVLNGKVLIKEGFKPWVVKSSTLGLDWGKVSALFVGGEKFILELRGKEDRWNQIWEVD